MERSTRYMRLRSSESACQKLAPPCFITRFIEDQLQVIASRAVNLYETRSGTRIARPVHVTIKQAAAMLHLSPQTASKMLRVGEWRKVTRHGSRVLD